MERATGDLWKLATEYLGAFAIEFGWTPDQVYDVPLVALVNLTMLVDKIRQHREATNTPAPEPNWRRLG